MCIRDRCVCVRACVYYMCVCVYVCVSVCARVCVCEWVYVLHVWDLECVRRVEIKWLMLLFITVCCLSWSGLHPVQVHEAHVHCCSRIHVFWLCSTLCENKNNVSRWKTGGFEDGQNERDSDDILDLIICWQDPWALMMMMWFLTQFPLKFAENNDVGEIVIWEL